MTALPVAGPDPRSVYTGQITNWALAASTCVGAVPVVVMGIQSSGSRGEPAFVMPLLLVAIGVLANVLTASSVRVTAGPNGFTTRWGLVGWPRCTYRIDEIELAEVVDVPWRRVSCGFWWTPKRTSCTIRSGPAVRLLLRNQRIVTVTVPEPAHAVAALHAAAQGRLS